MIHAIRCSWLPTVTSLLVAGQALPDDQVAGSDIPVSTPEVRTAVLRANTLIPLRLMEAVGSDTSQTGAHFRLLVTDGIQVGDLTVIPAGSIADGQVIHAAKSGMFGKAGELSITSRFVQVGERRIKLHSLYANAGQSKADLAFGVGIVIPLAPFFIKGKQVIVPADTELVARVAVDETFVTNDSAAP